MIRRPSTATLGLAAALLALGATSVLAAGPFGVGVPEAGGGASGGLFGWIAQQQSGFYRSLTGTVRALRTDPWAVSGLIGLSFAYGVFHAAGPGHGKAVIASYVVANDETVRRGILLSFVSAFLQAVVAILLVGIATAALNLTSRQITEATVALELASGVLVTGLGLWLVWTKVFRRGGLFAAPGGAGHVHGPDCRHAPLLKPVSPRFAAAGAGAGGGVFAAEAVSAGPMVCATCGHAADPAALAGPFSWRKAVSAVVAVGIRPCTGALIVLVFAFSQGLFWAGILSAFAMAVGTGITVAILATLAVSAKSLAVAIAGRDSGLGEALIRGAEILGALAILALGILILGATLLHGPSGG